MANVSAHPDQAGTAESAESPPRATGWRALLRPTWWRPSVRSCLIAVLVVAGGLMIVGAIRLWIVAGIIGVGAALGACAAGGYLDSWTWTGIGPYQYTKVAGQEIERGKTLWDLLQLLIIPAVLTVGGLWFGNQQQTAADRQRAREQARETLQVQKAQEQDNVLNSYLTVMSDLLLKNGLAGPHPSLAVRLAARVQTLAALRALDDRRIDTVTAFLASSNLYGNVRSSLNASVAPNLYENVRLSNQDLSYLNLRGADFKLAYLNGADLEGADLKGATLLFADLKGAQLPNADLQGADLSSAHLQHAGFSNANLAHALLNGADLRGADLSDADLTGADLSSAQLDSTTTLDRVTWDATTCPDGRPSNANHTSPQSCLLPTPTGTAHRRQPVRRSARRSERPHPLLSRG